MFKIQFKAAVRNLRKHRSFTFINIVGLTIGVTSFLLIALYIFDELAYDRFHEHADDVYRVVESRTSADGKTTRNASTGAQVSASSKNNFPEIKDLARISVYWRAGITTGDDKTKIFHEYFTVASPGFLRLFDFPLLQGDRNTALTAPRSILLTETTANRFFGATDVVGRTLFLDDDSIPYNVTGVLRDFPANSSIDYNMLASESSIEANPAAKDFIANDWTSGAFLTYLLLDHKADVTALNGKLDALAAAHHTNEAGTKRSIQLQALRDIHFHSNDIEGNSGKKGNISYLYVFLIVACFIIFLACINYMNLSTARFANRGKEIAVRKVAGASRFTLIQQILLEVLLVTLFAVLLSLVIVFFSLPAFNAFTEKHLALGLHTDYRIWLGMLLLMVLVTLLSGFYPAMFQSGLDPILLLKSRMRLGKGNISLRRTLVIFQFVISIVLIAATMIIFKQMHYVEGKDLGFRKDGLVVVDMNSHRIGRHAAEVRAEFSRIAQIRSVTATSRVPGEWKTIPAVTVRRANGGDGLKSMYFFSVDDQFLSTYDIKLMKGRNFFTIGGADSASVLINESAARQLGITEPSGQQITIPAVTSAGDNRSALNKPFTATVIGVVQDFHFQSLHEPLAPMVLGFQKNPVQELDYFTVKLSPGQVEGTLAKMKEILQSIDPDFYLEYHFLDKQWELLYREDRIRQSIFLFAALLAIFIAALGLLGLTIYAAEQRVKEIGIRKVLGASVGGIVLMLSRDFLKLVLVAAVIAIPIGWYVMYRWLEDFAYRITIHWTVFLWATVAAVVIAMATICLQVVKAAVANPVNTLRGE